MIIGLILIVVFGLLTAVFGIIPDFEVFSYEYAGTTTGAAGQVAAMLKTLDLFVPVSLAFTCLLALFGFKIFVGLSHLVVFVWDKLPFKSS